ncbi:MAG: hypothetical protein P8O07_05500 [Crocinitomicaceae bacterium]|nr:hypothetical protein [Crocinitomicaceae bacterium]
MNLKAKLDKRSIGIAMGLILPIISFFLFWQFKYGEKSPQQLWYYMTLNSANRNDLMIFPLLPNLVIFYFTNFQWRWDNFTTGIVGTTILLAIPVVITLIV